MSVRRARMGLDGFFELRVGLDHCGGGQVCEDGGVV